MCHVCVIRKNNGNDQSFVCENGFCVWSCLFTFWSWSFVLHSVFSVYVLIWHGTNEEQGKKESVTIVCVLLPIHHTKLLYFGFFSSIVFLWHFRSLTPFICAPFPNVSLAKIGRKYSKLVWKHAHIPIMGNNYFATIILNL